MLRENIAAGTVDKVYDAVHILFRRLELFNQVEYGSYRASCGEYIIVNKHHIILGDSICMDLHGIIAILLRI